MRIGRGKLLVSALATILIAGLLPAQAATAFEPLSQFGAFGTNPGELAFPTRIASDSDGNLYVEEYDNGRISVFDPAGGILRTIGSEGIGAGQLRTPFGTTIGPNGDLYVAEQNNNRISEFTASGQFVRAWGFDVDPSGGTGFEVCTPSTGCKAGTAGGGAGQLNDPSGTGTDASGDVFVGDAGNQRVDEFTASGEFVRAWGFDVIPGGGTDLETCTTATTCKLGLSGNTPGQMSNPTSVKIDAAGNLLVTESDNGRINKYTTAGVFLSYFGASGDGAGQLDEPTDIGLDGSGNIYLTEQDGNRVSEFNAAGIFIRAFGFGVIDGSPAFQVCTQATGCQIGVQDLGFGALSDPEGVLVDCRGAVYVTDSDNNRVERFGEPGTPLAPCPPPKPSNAFSLGKVHKNKNKGTAKLTALVPGAGALVLTGKGVKKQRPSASASKAVNAAGKVVLLVKAKGKPLKKLSRRGRAKLKLNVTYTPTGGDPNTIVKKLTLVKKLRR